MARALLLLLLASAVHAQDAEWLRTWTEAQRHRPASIASAARIAAPEEPGTPLLIRGRVYQRDGRTPAPNVVVFAYHTDAKGLYNGSRTGWRLRGWAKSDANGRFEFRTIRPGSYPGTRILAHVHMTVEGPNLPRRWAPELNFLDDPFVTASAKERSEAEGTFGSVRPVTVRNGVQSVEFNIRVEEEGRF